MGFSSSTFIFDGISSDSYGVYLGSFSQTSLNGDSGGSSHNVIKSKASRSSRFNCHGIETNDPLTFKLTMYFKGEIDRKQLSKIQHWLFNHHDYKRLQLVQSDMDFVHFNCILTDSEIHTLGGRVVGLTCTVECDSSFGWDDDHEISLTNLIGTNQVELINESDDLDYTFPVLSFKVLEAGNIIIKNTTDTKAELIFSNLQAGDEIIVDCRKQMIQTLTGINAFPKCNYKWLRLLPEYNNLIITGSFEYFKIAYPVARLIGA